MANMNVIRRLVLEADVSSAQGAASSVRALKQGFDEMAQAARDAATATDSTDKKLTSVANRVEAAHRRLDPATAAIREFERTVRTLEAGASQGYGLDRLARGLDLARQKLPEVRAETRRMADEQRAINDALAATERRLAASAAEWEAYRGRVAAARSVQAGAAFGADLDARLISGPGRSARDSASVFQERFALQEGSLAERMRRDTALVDQVLAERNRKVEQRERELDAIQERQFYREYRTERSDRGVGGRAADAREARRDATRAAGERDLGGYLTERLQQADPLASAYKRHEEAVERINRARALGLRTEQELASILAYEAKVLRDVERDFGSGKGGFRSNQRTNLGYQAYDVVGGLASGQPLPLIAAQQLPQIAQIIGDHEGGIAGGIKALKDGITPFRVAVGALSVTAIATGVALYQFKASMDAVETSVRGAGAASRTSAGQMDAAARDFGSFGNGGFGQSDARSIFAQMAQSGYASPGLFNADTARTAARYGRTTGQDAAGVGADFATIFGQDATKGLDLVQQKVGGITAAQKLYVETLAQSGERGRAHAEILRLIATNTVGATEGQSALTRGVNLLSDSWDKFKNNVGRGLNDLFDAGPLEQQLDRAQRLLREATKTEGLLGFDIMGNRAGAQNRVAAIQAQIDAQRKRGEEKAAATRGQEVSDLTRSILPDLDEQLRLETQIADLRKSGGSGKSVSLAQEAEAAARLKGALDSRLNLSERARASEEIALRSVTDRTLADRMVTAEKQKQLDLAGQSIRQEERLQQVAAARALEAARARREADDALRDARDASRSVGMLPFQKALTDQASEFRKELIRNPELASSQGLRRQNLVREQVGAPLQQSRLALNEQIANLEVQARSFYASAEGAGTLAAKQDLLNQYARAGIPVSADLMRQIDDLAARYGKAAGEADKFARTSQNIVQGMDEIRSGSRGLLTGVFSDFRQGKDPTQTLLNSLGRLQDQMFDRMVSKPLIEGALGFDGKGGGGLFGTGLSSIFGTVDPSGVKSALSGVGMTTTGTMTVNAGSVILNGGVGIGGSGLAGGAGGVVSDLTRGSAGSPSAASPTVVASAASTVPGSVPSLNAIGLPSWTSADQTRFNPTLGASNVNAYLSDGSRAGAGLAPMVGPLTQQADAMRNAGTNLTTAVDNTASGVGASGTDLVGALSSIPKALGNIGSGGFNLLGAGSASASSSGGFQDIAQWNADGGYITGPGGPRSDSILSWLSNGEYVVNAASTARNRPLLEHINAGRPVGAFADGGYANLEAMYGARAQPVSLPPMPMLAPVMAPAASSNASPSPLNVVINEAPGVQSTVRRDGDTITIDQMERGMERRMASRMNENRGAMSASVRNQANGGSAGLVG